MITSISIHFHEIWTLWSWSFPIYGIQNLWSLYCFPIYVKGIRTRDMQPIDMIIPFHEKQRCGNNCYIVWSKWTAVIFVSILIGYSIMVTTVSIFMEPWLFIFNVISIYLSYMTMSAVIALHGYNKQEPTVLNYGAMTYSLHWFKFKVSTVQYKWNVIYHL